jgi:hypothetical protein
MVVNQKDKNTHVTDSKIGVIGDHVTVHRGTHFYQSNKIKMPSVILILDGWDE